MEWIFPVGIAQSIFSAFILFTRKFNTLADRILAFWMIFISLELVHMLVEINESPLHGFTSNFGFYSLTFGPFLYLYVSKLTQENPRFRPVDFLHFLPYVVFSLLHLLFFTNRPIKSGVIETEQWWFLLNILRVIALFISLSVYSFVTIRVIIKHKKSIKDKYSFESSNITLAWLRQVTYIFIATYLMLIINMLIGNLAQSLLHTSHYIPAIGLTFFCFSLSYYGFSQPVLFQNQSIGLELQNLKANEELLGSEKKSAYLIKLQDYLEREKPYLNPELSIQGLADGVKLPRHYITEILKEKLGKNFFTLVNEYRIEEVKTKLVNPEFNQSSVLQVALDSGFNSKSSFNAIFKQYTEMTPSEFRKNHNI